MRPMSVIPILMMVLSLPAGGQSASDQPQSSPALPPGVAAPQQDYEMARDAVARGAFLPLDQILDIVSASHPGRLVEVELEMEDGAWVYEVEIITPQGRLIEVELNAATGEILTVEDDDD